MCHQLYVPLVGQASTWIFGIFPDDQEIELPLNSMHQLIDDGMRAFTRWLGTIARKPHMCPIRYLNWKDMLEELKQECWHVVEKIGKAWRDHKGRLKSKHYIPHSRNKARVKNNRLKGCIAKDWDVLVEHWCTDDAVIESEKNKDHHSKQDDLHTAASCSYAMHATKKAKANGRPIKRAALCSILHTHKDGSTINPVVQEKMEKMKELLADPSNQLQLSNTSGSIAWSLDDVFAKVMGKERQGHIRGLGFGPSLGGRSSKSALTNIQIQSSQARDNEVAQLKASLATMEEKLACFYEMKEKLSQFEDMEQRMARMLQQMQQISSQCNQV
ncbi:uncharacterized protein LOC142635752 [Castanea sativa]|uniref:uncharacterized protein LOC142635752 n=1 Tax=Castanea sativa TaxID=21020 RepID=UPI003F64CE39